MRTKAADWFDTAKRVPVYGIKVLKDGKWHTMGKRDDKGFMHHDLYYKKEERDARRAELRKAKWD